MSKPRLLDLFCGAGGATKGYQRAGFFVIGVDIESQPRYVGDAFEQGDALAVLQRLLDGGMVCGYSLAQIAAFAASPPCQFASEQTPMEYRSKHPNLIPETRRRLLATGKPYVIENVENARRHLITPLMLCGSMFGLPVWRHRYFECNPAFIFPPATCNHTRRPVTFSSGSHSRALNRLMSPVLISGTTRRSPANGGRFEYTVQDCRDAIDCQWMTREEIDEAVPPVYTEYISKHLLAALESRP